MPETPVDVDHMAETAERLSLVESDMQEPDFSAQEALIRKALAALPDADLLAPVDIEKVTVAYLYSNESRAVLDSLVRWACIEIVEADDPIRALERGIEDLQAMLAAIQESEPCSSSPPCV